MRRRSGRKANPIIAAAYIRCSTEEQSTEGMSLAAQEDQLRAYCKMRGLELVELVCDPGVSAGKELRTRAGGRRLLDLVKQGDVGAVVGLKLDRLFRNTIDALTIAGDWDKRGVALHLVDMGGTAIDTSTAIGQYIFTMLAGAAEMERNLIRERTRDALAAKRRRSELVGRIPFGHMLSADGKHLQENPDEQAVIVLVRRLRASGQSQQAIADKLNQDRVPARGRRGEPASWSQAKVGRLLRRERDRLAHQAA